MWQTVDLPEENGKFIFKDLLSEYRIKNRDVGQTAIGTLSRGDSEPAAVILPLRFPSYDRTRNGYWTVSLAGREEKYYTGLQVNKDPGVWVVYSGFLIMILGCFVSFFMAHDKVCIQVREKNGKSLVSITGTANKNKLAIPKKLKTIAEKLSAIA